MTEVRESRSSMAAATEKGDPHGGSEEWDKGQWGSQGQDPALHLFSRTETHPT